MNLFGDVLNMKREQGDGNETSFGGRKEKIEN